LVYYNNELNIFRGELLSVLQTIIFILLICFFIGLLITKLLLKKEIIQESPKIWTFLLMGLLIGFALFLVVILPSLVIYWTVLGTNSFFGDHLVFENRIDLYVFSLAVSILAFVYMLFFVLLLKIAVIKFRISKVLSFLLEFMLVSFSIYLSLIYISNEVIVPVHSSNIGIIMISILVSLIFSGLDNILDEIDKLQKKYDNKVSNSQL